MYTAYSARVVTPGPCTCLSKEYTQEGAVLFKDRCTNEAAMNLRCKRRSRPVSSSRSSSSINQQYVQPQPQAK